MRRTVIVTLLAVMVVLAGCTGQLGEDTEDPADSTTSASPVTEQTTTVATDELSFPDGYDENGVTDLEQALDTHWSGAADAGTYVSRLSGTEKSAVSENTTLSADVYVGDGTGYLHERRNGQESYRTYRSDLYNSSIVSDVFSFSLNAVMKAEHFEFEEATVRNGTTLFVYRSDELDTNASVYDYYEEAEVTNHSAKLVVDATGRIRAFETSTDFERDGDWFDLDVAVTFSEYGTAEKPDWADRAEGTTTEGSTQTGERSSDVANRVAVVGSFGNVTESATVDYVNVTVMRGSGSSDIDLSNATISWVGPNVATTLTYDAGHGGQAAFGVAPLVDDDGSAPVLDDPSDRFSIVLNVEALAGEPLRPGQEAQLKLTTQKGATTVYRLNVPESLAGETAVVL